MLQDCSSSLGIPQTELKNVKTVAKEHKNKNSGKENRENGNASDKVIGKRKRKTEREIKILRSELKRNVMWTRESIKVMRANYADEFSMSEQQIYKWWWDQTRKRSKKVDTQLTNGLEQFQVNPEGMSPDLLVSFQDEFGGYSSRLRLNGNKQQKVGEVEEMEEDKMEFNLCTLLGIDVEAIAYRIAIGEDHDNILEKKATAVSSSEIIDIETES